MARTKNPYVTNAEFLTEIHKSKTSYCQYDAPEYSTYDAIVSDKAEITKPFVDALFAEKADRASKKKLPPPIKEKLVYRVMTREHIPEEIEKLNFPPFKHYILEQGQLKEVGRSHCKNGQFSDNHGRMTNRLAVMMDLLVYRISTKPGWRGYSYVDEMRGAAIMQLIEHGLKFNEKAGIVPNPFAYYTTVVTNAFLKILAAEKRVQGIRDELMMAEGLRPSYSKQMEHEASFAIENLPEETPKRKTRGKAKEKPAEEISAKPKRTRGRPAAPPQGLPVKPKRPMGRPKKAVADSVLGF